MPGLPSPSAHGPFPSAGRMASTPAMIASAWAWVSVPSATRPSSALSRNSPRPMAGTSVALPSDAVVESVLVSVSAHVSFSTFSSYDDDDDDFYYDDHDYEVEDQNRPDHYRRKKWGRYRLEK